MLTLSARGPEEDDGESDNEDEDEEDGPPGFFLRRGFPAEGSFFPTSWFTFFLLLSYIFPRFEKLK